jgi:hypothetical protein
MAGIVRKRACARNRELGAIPAIQIPAIQLRPFRSERCAAGIEQRHGLARCTSVTT